jgi:hypothetical protein
LCLEVTGKEKRAIPIVKAEKPGADLSGMLAAVQTDEIDFRSLRENVLRVLERRPKASIGDVLWHFPAEQGLGSVVGLMHLAARHGEREPLTETVAWVGPDGKHRSAGIDKWCFFRERSDELSA